MPGGGLKALCLLNALRQEVQEELHALRQILAGRIDRVDVLRLALPARKQADKPTLAEGIGDDPQRQLPDSHPIADGLTDKDSAAKPQPRRHLHLGVAIRAAQADRRCLEIRGPADEREFTQVRWKPRNAFAAKESRRRYEHAWRDSKLASDLVPRHRRPEPKCDIKFSVDKVHTPIIRIEVDLDARMTLKKLLYPPPPMEYTHRDAGRDPQTAFGLLSLPLESARELAELFDQSTAAGVEHAALWRYAHSVVSPFEQARTQSSLQPADQSTHGGLRQASITRGCGDATELDHANEGIERSEIIHAERVHNCLPSRCRYPIESEMGTFRFIFGRCKWLNCRRLSHETEAAPSPMHHCVCRNSSVIRYPETKARAGRTKDSSVRRNTPLKFAEVPDAGKRTESRAHAPDTKTRGRAPR